MKNFVNAIARIVFGLRRPSKAANRRLLRARGENLESLTIREAIPEDIPALAALHVKTWKETYWNVKNPPTYGIREQQWREQFKVTDGRTCHRLSINSWAYLCDVLTRLPTTPSEQLPDLLPDRWQAAQEKPAT